LVFEPAFGTEPVIAEDDGNVDVAFTSANFTLSESATYGWTFKVVRGTNTVANALVSLIESAQTSIHIASGHLRSRPVAEALMHKMAATPGIDLRILTDGQEYIGKTTHFEQMEELDACVGAAEGNEAKEDACSDNNFYYGYLLDQAGIALRYKYYAYRWDYSYADQMHHKFFVVDGERIATGSYNLSDNAEHNTLENMVFLDDAAAPGIAARYEAEFERLWSLGQQADLYRKYMDDVDNGSGPLPIVFEPMALEWAQIADLKRAVVTACPDVNSEPFRTEPEKHQSCSR
jgi:phosphatidylserine/phosphatidylglycerophosphate/cardiolipin synthase-like enzyme